MNSRYLMRNSKDLGTVTIFTYQQGKKFISVCLELDIVKKGSDKEEINREISESIVGYVKTIVKEGLGDQLLNRPAEKKYWDKYDEFLATLKQRSKVRSKVLGSINRWEISTMATL